MVELGAGSDRAAVDWSLSVSFALKCAETESPRFAKQMMFLPEAMEGQVKGNCCS